METQKQIEEVSNEICALENALMGVNRPSWFIMKTQQKLFQARRRLDALKAVRDAELNARLSEARFIDAISHRQQNSNWFAFLIVTGLTLLVLVYLVLNLKQLNLWNT